MTAGDLSWDDPDFAGSVIEPDQMPEAAQANPWLDAVGAAAGSAYRDLPFGRITVSPARRWAGNTTDGLDVQIGVDSKGEPQHFVMGVRGVHHGLVGGDVRMGKTNLLHVLISQLALRYPPEELELYLLDFKEVEFDAYLTERLPHARAITSRTDREFGLSDAAAVPRGDRAAGPAVPRGSASRTCLITGGRPGRCCPGPW